MDPSSVSVANQNNQSVQALVQQAVNAALDKAQRQWLSALAPVLISMRGKEGGDSSSYYGGMYTRTPIVLCSYTNTFLPPLSSPLPVPSHPLPSTRPLSLLFVLSVGVGVALGMTDHPDSSGEAYTADTTTGKGYNHQDQGYGTADRGYSNDGYGGSFEEKTGGSMSIRGPESDTPSPPPPPPHGYSATTGGYTYPHPTGHPSGSTSSHTHTHNHTPAYTTTPRGYTGTHPHLSYPQDTHPHSTSTMPVANLPGGGYFFDPSSHPANNNNNNNTPYQRIAALESGESMSGTRES